MLNDTHRFHADEINSIENQEHKLMRFVELNAIESAINFLKNTDVQKYFTEYGFPIAYTVIYDLKTGLLKNLKVDLSGKMKEFGEIFKLHLQDDQPGSTALN